MEQDRRVRALKAAIQEGITSGVSDRNVPDIMEAVEARLRADGRLKAYVRRDHRRERESNVDSEN